MNIIYKVFACLLFLAISQQTLNAQTCPSVDAQAGTGASTTICSGQCANLTATVVAVKATTSYSVGSITYSPYPFSGGTAAIGNIDDLWSSAINIGFNFCYFGNTFNQVLIGSNGEITFDVSAANSAENFATTAVLPNLTEHVGNSICVAYRDIDPSSGASSSVFTYTTGVAPCRKFVAYWSNIPLFQCNTPASTFQIVLHEGTNIIETYVQNSTSCAAWQSGRGLMGIQNATGTTAVAPPGRNVLTPWTATNEAWRYMPTGANTFTVNWAGPNGFTATGLTAAPCPTATSTYTATMNVSDCAGAITSFSSSVQVSVTPTPTAPIVATPTAICRGASATLSATGASSYSWAPGGATTSSITVSPTVTTTYTLTRNNSGCSTTQTISLVVNANPTVTALSSPTVLCSGGSSTLTGGGAVSYTWNPGALTGNTVVVSPTVSTQYTVTGTNAAGCTATRTVNVTVSTTPTVTATASSATACSGSSVTLTSSGASTYTWTPGNIVGATVLVTPTANTTYTVRGRNAAGCIGTNTVDVTVTPGVTFTVTATPTVICRGGTSTLTATGVTSYTWLPGTLTGSTVTVSPVSTTVYTVTGSNGGACTATKFITVAVSVPNITAARTPTAVCAGSSSTLSATGGAGSSYTWAPVGLTGTPVVVTPTATTVYTVTGANALGCTNTRTTNVVVLANPTVNIAASSASICPGLTTTLTASGAVGYTWSPGSFTTTSIAVTPTASSTYTVRGRNSSGCVSTTTIGITVFPSVTISPIASPATICTGGGSTLTATGASSYTWNPGALNGASVAVTPTTTSIYTVTGTDANNCIGSSTLSVNVSSVNLVASSNPTILCSTATATLTGTGAVSYTWNPGGVTTSTMVVTPASTTVYTLTGVDAFGCSATKTLNLSVGVTPTVTASASSSTICAGTSLTLSSSGATTYTWSPGALTGSVVVASPTISTTYTLNGQNAAGCIATKTVFVNVNPLPVIDAPPPPILCSGSSTTLTASGASTYTWNPGALTGGTITVSPLATTVYTVVGTSSLNCTGTATVNLKVTATPTINITASPSVICTGGSSTLTASGANTYTWSPGGATGSSVVVTPTATAIYTVSGDNGFGCVSNHTISLTVSSGPTVTAGASPAVICSGNSSTLTASGALTFTWQPGAATGSTTVVNPSSTTVYTVTGSDISGCTNSVTTTVNISAAPSLTLAASPGVICNSGSSTLTATGASSYTWNPGGVISPSVVVTPTTNTTYTVNGSNALGCIATNTLSLLVSANPTITASASSASICVSSNATLTAGGASTYTWNPGGLTGASVTVSPSSNTTYTVTGTNLAGCSATQTVAVSVVSAPVVTATTSNSLICSGSSVVLSGSGASSYTWNPGGMNGSSTIVSPTTTTTYTLQGDNGIGCIGTATVSVVVNSTPTLSAVSNPGIICGGGSATLTASGATSYIWNPGSLLGTSIVVTPTATTQYTLTGVSGACSNSITVTVSVGVTPTVSAAVSVATICAGGSTTLTASGASTYTWSPGALTGSNVAVSPTVSTTYTVAGDNGTGCIASSTVDVVVNSAPSITITPSSTFVCAPGSVTLTASGAANYTWMPGGATTPSITGNPTVTTIYTVTGTNATGCSATQTVTIVESTPVISAAGSPTAICAGSTATLTATGATTYTWAPLGVTGASVTDSPTVTTTYTVTGDNGSCTSTQTLSLVVNSSPTVTANSSPSKICSGSSSTLTATGALTYTWNPGALAGSSVAVTPTTTTTYTVVADNGTGCVVSTTVDVIVSPLPSVSITPGSTFVCAPGSVTLTASGAVNYTWMPGGANTPGITDSPTVTTTYTVTGQDLIGCTNTQTITITENTPVISVASSPTAICAGNTATLTASGATTYTWAPLGVSGATATDSPTVTTTYTVTGDNGSCTGTQTLTLVVNANPTITATASTATICTGSSTSLTASGASTYTWNPGALTGSNVAVSPTVSTTYTVDGDNGTGCITSSTVDVFVNPAPSVSVVATPTILCAPGSVTLTASGANTYTWIPSGTTGATLIDNPSVTTTYSVTGEDLLGCTATQTLTFSVGIPTITIAGTTTICAGNAATLTAGGALTYTWAPLGVTGTTITDSPTVTTTYTVTGDNGGCIGTETITVVVNNYPVIIPSAGSATICAGSSTSLSATGALTYTWNPGALTGSNVAVSPTVTTTYTVDGDNGTGCVATATVDVVVNPAPSVSIAATPGILCTPGPVTLTASGANTYTWIPSGTAGATFTDSPSVTTTYSVTGEDLLGCTATQTITISVGNPTLSLSSTSGTICSGSTTTLTASGALTYTWAPLGISGTTITDSPTVTTTYTVTGDNGGCIGTETITVVVNSVPGLTISSTSASLCAGNAATLTASGATTYTWSPGVLTGTNVVVTPTATTTYTLDGDNGTGCIGTTTLMIAVNALPSVSVVSTSTLLCGSGSVTLTAAGATTYTWIPSGTVGAGITDSPTVTTTYTVNGEDASGCINTTTLTVNVSSLPSLTLATFPSTICAGSAAALNASGASTYTWNPGGLTGSSIIDAPSVTTTYTVTGDNGAGCTNTETVTLTVVSGAPALTVTASPALICAGSNSTLTATGATSYTWLPVSVNTASAVVNPTVATTYTILADNGLCVSTATLLVDVAPLPANVTATSSGSITCSSPTVDLFGGSTSTGVNYSWNGPASYTSSVQNPTGIAIDGDYTLTVTDALSGCSASTTVSVVSNTVIPVVGVTSPSPLLGCNTTVTLSVVTTSTLLSWSGPGGFTSSAITPTTSVAGDYTVTVTDPVNGCQNTVVITIGTSTVLPAFTATAMPATCSGTVANADGMIMISGFSGTDTYDISQAATYTGTATYGTAFPIPFGGTLLSSLANPATATPYTIRLFSANGCFKDTTVMLTVTNCNSTPVTVLGMTKAVSTPTLVNGNAYNVTYTIVATNASTVNIDNFSITDNLSATFPAPSSFSVIATPSVVSLNSNLTVNPGFDGSLQTNLTIPGSSTLTAGKVDTLVFTVQILPNGFFGPFNNSAVGTGTDNSGAAVSDSSNTGFAWDPDGNGDPTDNNIPTVLNLTPNSVIGIAKAGSVSGVLDDKTVDVTYVFTVKNLGNDTIKNVQVLDTLLINAPAQFTIKSGPFASSLSANSNYNGVSDIKLLDGLGKLSPGSVETITVVINIKPEGVKTITNTAVAVGFSQAGAIVRDTSMNGNDPDPNANGYAGDSGESVPTVLDLPDVELFVPEVFTPDGDGKNDFFVIKGISGRTAKLTVYNRWGSVVYKNDAYDNTWDGLANVKTMVIGNSRLPQGTYYYIVEFEDGKDDPIKGYVVLQY